MKQRITGVKKGPIEAIYRFLYVILPCAELEIVFRLKP